MLKIIKKILSLKPKPNWSFDPSELASVPVGGVIIANYGFLEKCVSPEWIKLEDNRWRDKKGIAVTDDEIVMPFTVLEPTSF